MDTRKLEYDSTLGGTVVLPSHVPTYRYAASALQEIKTLLNEVQNPTNTKLIFQSLPKHMRRRAMSHHPKRLPRKYRKAHNAQMAKAGKPKQSKRPSRKYRRRPKNLICEYLRRQRKHIWLETHLWHAKRFHMVDRWGYRLPYASCDKTYRACYRASAQHCLVQDISYYACIELVGDIDLLRSGFARMSSSECGLSITAKTYVSGRREGSIELFRDGQYPLGALGRISFMWQPSGDEEDHEAKHMLWLWLHPCAYQTILEELIQVFELINLSTIKVPLNDETEVKKGDEIISNEKTKANNSKKPCRVKDERRLKFMTRTLGYERVKSYANKNNSIKLNSLKDRLNRFRLTGPQAQNVLTAAFKSYFTKSTSENWLKNLHEEDSTYQEAHQTQTEFWQKARNLSSPSDLLSNIIIGLNIVDPRLQRPKRRTKAEPNGDNYESAYDLLSNTSTSLPMSALWQSSIRDKLCRQMLSTHVYCDLRAKHAIVPGAPCAFEQDMQPVPVILIQRPGVQQNNYKRLSYGCGYDIIIPAGYGMNIWMALVMWGAKPGGLREFETIAREAGTEQHLPDTVTGRQESALNATELQTQYFRMPPNRRSNYIKLAVVSPFRAPFSQLIRDWLPEKMVSEIPNGTSYYVLRKRELLQRIDNSVRRHFKISLPETEEISSNCLIQIHLRLRTRGNLQPNALICLPTAADFKRQLKQIKHDDYDPIYTEPLLADPNEKQRRLLRQTHKQMLKRLRARRVREKRKKQETATRRVRISPAKTAKLVANHLKEMCNLWIPTNAMDTVYSVRKQATRDVFGYVTKGSFSFLEGTVCAVGYVTVAGLRALLEVSTKSRLIKQPIMCLVRDIKSRHYRFATFKVNLDVSKPAY